MKLKHIAIIGSLFPILFSLVLFFGVLISADSDDENSNFSSGITGMNLSAEVLKHQPMVEKYAREYGISEYVNVLLAIIQVESGGMAYRAIGNGHFFCYLRSRSADKRGRTDKQCESNLYCKSPCGR